MEISVRIEKVLDVQQVTSRKDGKTYNKYSFVGSTTNEQYSKKICFTVFGEDKWNELGVGVGRSYSLSVDLSSREWQGRWYTEVSVWKAVAIGGESTAPVAPQPSAQQAPQYAQPYAPQPQPQPQGGSDGLPF